MEGEGCWRCFISYRVVRRELTEGVLFEVRKCYLGKEQKRKRPQTVQKLQDDGLPSMFMDSCGGPGRKGREEWSRRHTREEMGRIMSASKPIKIWALTESELEHILCNCNIQVSFPFRCLTVTFSSNDFPKNTRNSVCDWIIVNF